MPQGYPAPLGLPYDEDAVTSSSLSSREFAALGDANRQPESFFSASTLPDPSFDPFFQPVSTVPSSAPSVRLDCGEGFESSMGTVQFGRPLSRQGNRNDDCVDLTAVDVDGLENVELQGKTLGEALHDETLRWHWQSGYPEFDWNSGPFGERINIGQEIGQTNNTEKILPPANDTPPQATPDIYNFISTGDMLTYDRLGAPTGPQLGASDYNTYQDCEARIQEILEYPSHKQGNRVDEPAGNTNPTRTMHTASSTTKSKERGSTTEQRSKIRERKKRKQRDEAPKTGGNANPAVEAEPPKRRKSTPVAPRPSQGAYLFPI